MSMYSADDVAAALNTLVVQIVAPLIATHPDGEDLYDRLYDGLQEIQGEDNPALTLVGTVVENLLRRTDEEWEAGTKPDRT